jgi:hypothetical protein
MLCSKNWAYKKAYVDTFFQKQDNQKTFALDTALQKSFALDVRFGALASYTVARQIDAMLKRLGAAKSFGLAEAETYTVSFGLDARFAYKVRLPELWFDENGRIILNILKPYPWVGS